MERQNENVKQVIVMRNDLGMRKGKMIAQGAHASLKVFTDIMYVENDKHVMDVGDAYPSHESAIVQWLEARFAKICVRVNSEQELLEINKQAKEAGLPVALILDSGKTEFDGVPTYTCLAIGPAKAKKIDKITGHLKLL